MAHLIFLTSTPATVAAGSGTWVGISVLRDAIVARGHEVTMLAPERSERGTTFARLLFNLKVRARLRALKADVLVGFDLDGVLAPGKGTLHVAAIKGVLADEAGHERGARRLALACQAALEGWHVRRADRVITTSRYSTLRIAESYGVKPEAVSVVPELIDLEAWRRALERSALEGGPLRILCVAHLYPRKGVDTLLRAFARLRGDAVLRIVGVGPEAERLHGLARELAIDERVQFLGYLPFAALVAEYRNAALFALSTEQEGFGIVFLEAMASSLPVVATRVAAVPEVVVEDVTALLVAPRDDRMLAEALAGLLEDPARRLAIGTAGSAHVARFAAPVVARQFLAAVGIDG